MVERSPSGRATHERSQSTLSPPTVGIPNAGTCKACGEYGDLEDKNCFACNAEGPCTRLKRITPWVACFAWKPVRVDGGWIWLSAYQRQTYKWFGIENSNVRRGVA